MVNKTFTFTPDEYNVLNKEYPKTLKEIEKYVKESVQFMDDGQVSEKEWEEVVRSIISYSPRMLYDFFDSKEVYPSVWRTSDGVWHYSLGSVQHHHPNGDRLQVEKQVMMNAFKKTEEAL